VNILFLSTWFPWPLDNGSKVRVYHLLKGLAARHRVTLLSFAFGTSAPAAVGNLRASCTDVRVVQCDPFDRDPVTRALRFLSLAPVVARPLPEMSRVCRRTLAQASFDLVIASTEVMSAYAWQALPTTPKILEEHNSLSRWMWDRYRQQTSSVQRVRCWATWLKTRLYESRLFRRFDLCTMVSEQDRDACLHMLPGYRGPVEVVPNGVDCAYHRLGLVEPAPNTLIFNGALTYYANHDAMRHFLADIYPVVRRQNAGATLTITGPTAGVDLQGLELDGTVRLSGYVDDVRPFVGGAWACVVPLRQGGGTHLKVLEAMALGTPVIATSKGVEGLEAIPGKHVLVADDPGQFAQLVVRLLADPDLRARLSANARRLVEERYDWVQIGARFAALCEAVAQR